MPAGYDPSGLSLTGWWRDYPGVPWAGTSSAGGSGTTPGRDLEAGNVGGSGVLASGRVPFAGDGASTYLVGHAGLTWGDLVGIGDFYVAAVVRWDSAAATAGVLDDPGILTDNGGSFGVSYSTDGVRAFVYDGSGTPQLRTVGPVAAAAGVLHLIQWWWDSAGSTMWLAVDGGAPVSAPLFDSSFGGANAITVGANWALTAFLDGDVYELMSAQSSFDAATRLSLRGYATERYGGAFGWWESTTDYVRGAPVGRGRRNAGPFRRRRVLRAQGANEPGPVFVARGIARPNRRRPIGPFAMGPDNPRRPLRSLMTFASIPGPVFVARGIARPNRRRPIGPFAMGPDNPRRPLRSRMTFASIPGPVFVARGTVPRIQRGVPPGVGRATSTRGPWRAWQPTLAYLTIVEGGGADQTIALASIDGSEAFGAVAILPADVAIAIAGLASSEHVGSVALAPGATTLGIASVESDERRGPLAVAAVASIALGGVASGERRGPLGVSPGASAIALGGVRSAERRGPVALAPATVTVPLAGLPSREARGPLVLAAGTVSVGLAGARSAERRGPVALAPGVASVALAGVRTAERRGPLTLTPGSSTVALAGIRSAERLGYLTLAVGGGLDQVVTLAGLRSAERRGPVAFSAGATVLVLASVRTAERRGPLTLTPGSSTVALAGIRSAERLGYLTLAVGGGLDQVVTLAGLRSAERRGPVAFSAGATVLVLASVRTAERRGPLALTPGSSTVALAGIRSAERRGPLALGASTTIALGGVRSAERRGPVALAPATVTVPLAGLRSSALVGPLALATVLVVELGGVRSAERVGPVAPTIPLVVVPIHLDLEDPRPWLAILGAGASPRIPLDLEDPRPWLVLEADLASPRLDTESQTPAEPWLRFTSEIPPMPQINIGDDAAPTVRVRDPDGVLVDPSTVSLVVRSPSGVVSTYVYPAAQIEKVGVGIYRARIPITASGTWRYRWVFTSPNGAEPGAFNVPADEF